MIKKTIKSLKLGFELGFITLLLIGLIYYFNLTQYINIEQMKYFIEISGMYGMIIYILGFLFLSLIGISVSPLIFLGGVLFSFIYGFIVSFIALFLASVIAFYVSHFVSNIIHKGKHKTHGHKFKVIDKIIKKLESKISHNQFKTIFLSKFLIPNILVSYALGTMYSEIRKVTFIVATFLNNLVYCFLLIFLGSKFTENLSYLFVALAFVFGFYIIRYYYKSHYTHTAPSVD